MQKFLRSCVTAELSTHMCWQALLTWRRHQRYARARAAVTITRKRKTAWRRRDTVRLQRGVGLSLR